MARLPVMPGGSDLRDHLFVGRVPEDLGQLATARRLFEPGTGVSYNNAAFSIAGEVIDAASGEPFPSFAKQRFLEPLGIRGFFAADDAITHRVAAPHHVIDADTTIVLRGTGWQPGWELAPIDRAAGGLITSVDGSARFRVAIGFMAPRQTTGIPLVTPPSSPPARLLGRVNAFCAAS